MNIEITLLCTIAGAMLGYMSYKKKNEKDIEDDASQKTVVATKLDYISKGVDDIRLDIKAQDTKISNVIERLIKVEESTKSAHHRIDTIEKTKGEIIYEK
ncbi:MAG: hypothetical protein ACLUG9_16405 [Paraclostridium sordellii]|uniref:Uncharacterized protein n=1 Tax=Paraclostridium sordellii TaxID=1505 RepID=A0ABM9RTK9_PARSO|nr:hypothetical protein [Paeniclostridium sordellii]EPZ61795.1 hypothetical protein H477_5926 [[Clostridium] sordellii ATCC 9714] [Paeniclostridium sordellii ATCC 9714]MCQ4699074.1 hypothetical protein [Paeniclostridium sordellii]CEJ75424.1 hypothetical protein ATCC9714_PCS200171 (plasmid) [[Clostridium] sordellii] [Paeniclostridium sordellii]CEN68016.1 Uncharacterised protein [[Clostridium] sordellii] [Paeniclostridium sordellii]CEN71293.1 Uncharacterised protein [[Clostridium] sordellii] [Pa